MNTNHAVAMLAQKHQKPQMEATQVEEDPFAEADTMAEQSPSFEDVVEEPETQGNKRQENPSPLNPRKGKQMKAKMLKEWQKKCDQAEETLKNLEQQRMQIKKEKPGRVREAIEDYRKQSNNFSSP